MKWFAPKTIVILHGWGLSGETFAPLADVLTSMGYRVHTPDLSGFGKSSVPTKPYDLSDYASDVDAYCRRHGIKRTILLGHSFGGRVALKYVSLFPNKAYALILTGTPGLSPIPRKRLLFFILLAKIGGFIFSIPPLNLVNNFVRRWYYYAVGAKDFFRAEGVMRETFKAVVAEDLVPMMETLAVPVLLLWGELDIVVPTSIAAAMEHIITGAKLIIIPGADHGVPFKEPVRFAGYIEKFLQRL